jgi:hypothetical protein
VEGLGAEVSSTFFEEFSMKKNVLLACAGMACCSVALATPPGVPQAAPAPTKVDPIALATVRRIDGRLVRTSDWVPYSGNVSRETGTLWFDSFQTDESHAPAGGTECGLPGDGYRWWFGSAYHAPACAEDMTYASGGGGQVINEYSLAWGYQVVGGTPIDTSFGLIIFTYNEMIDNTDCSSSSVGVFPDDFTPASDGVLANYGQLPQGNWYSNIDGLNDLAVLMPDGDSGTYEQLSVWIDDVSGDLFICPASLSPFFWGTADDGGISGRPGTNDIQEYLDDGGGVGDPDFAYDASTECYDMTAGVCPDPLGNMGMFWIKGDTCTGSADHDGDGFITGIDFDLFVADFEFGCLDNTPPCTNSADHDGDGFITGIDYDLFVADFEAGCL